jgi:hypothetical protein
LYAGVSGLQGADRGPRTYLGRGCEPAGGDNFLTPRSVILSFYLTVDNASTINVKTSMVAPQEVSELKVQERPAST